MRPSAVQARPFDVISPSTIRCRPPSESSRYSTPTGRDRLASSIVPAQNRPSGDTLPSLKRVPGSMCSGAVTNVSAPVPKSNRCNPSARATTAPPEARSPNEPIRCGIGQPTSAPVAGSNRCSAGSRMSTQYSACSSAAQTGHSPSSARASSTHVTSVSIAGAFPAALFLHSQQQGADNPGAPSAERTITGRRARAVRDRPDGAQDTRAAAQPSLVRREGPALVRPPLAHRADGLRPPTTTRGKPVIAHHQHLERHQPLPHPLPAARRGGQARRVAGGRLPGGDAGDDALRAVPEAHHDAVPQPPRDGDRGAAALVPARRRGADGRLRQDHAGLLMGAISMDLPAIFMPAGPMLRGDWGGKHARLGLRHLEVLGRAARRERSPRRTGRRSRTASRARPATA